jgi:hypothetical protein
MQDVKKSRAVAGMTRSAFRLAAFGLMFLGLEGAANAAVPEIDPGSMTSGLALLAGGMLWLSGRRPRK